MTTSSDDATWTPPATRELTTSDGRTLQYSVYGPEDGVRVIWHSGTPGTHWLPDKPQHLIRQHGLRSLFYDRPGYGGSTRQPGRSVVDAAEDAVRLADAEGWDRFATCGGSGGGPHTLALAARFPDRVTRCAAVVCPAPFDADGLDWWAGMSPGNVEEFTLARTDLPAYRALVERIGATAADRIRAGEVAIPPEYEMAESDLELFRQRLEEHNPGRIETGIRSWTSGFDGWADDGVALTRPWGFAVSSLSVPVSVWYGPDDVLCPHGHTEWLLAHIPGVERRELSGGHGLTDRDMESVFDWLAARAPHR